LELWFDEEKKKTVVFITHDLDEAIFLSDRVIMLTESPGRVYLDIRVPCLRPRDRYGLLSSVAYLDFRRKLSAEFFNIQSGKIENEWVVI
jgi:NitT/TauT family transport system ATP-binding protein